MKEIVTPRRVRFGELSFDVPFSQLRLVQLFALCNNFMFYKH